MKTFYDYWESMPAELKNEYGPGAVVAARLAWEACMGEVLKEICDIVGEY